MIIQQEFDQIISLLKSKVSDFPQAENLLDDIDASTVSFYTESDQKSAGTPKEVVMGVTELEAQLAEQRGDTVTAVKRKSLLQTLKTSDHEHLLISYFLTPTAGFKIYTDLDRNNLLEIQKTQGSLPEEQEKYLKLRTLIANTGISGNIEIDDSQIKNLFKHGQLHDVETCTDQ